MQAQDDPTLTEQPQLFLPLIHAPTDGTTVVDEAPSEENASGHDHADDDHNHDHAVPLRDSWPPQPVGITAVRWLADDAGAAVAGCYTIGIVLPDGFTFSPANVGNDNTDSDINPGTAMSDNINLGTGQTITNVDAGLVPQGGGGDTCIGDRTWRDNNINGLQDPGEPGIDGVEIYLGVDDNGDGRLDRYLGSTVSANGGQYEFCGLDPALIYALEFSAPPNFCGFTLPNVGNDDAIDSDPDISKGVALGIVVVAGQRNDTIDAGYACHD